MISVIIPTHNRQDVLIRTLTSLEEQDFSKTDFEVLVVDDGSQDRTRAAVEDFRSRTDIRLRYFRQKKAGPAQARNLGVDEACGDLLLFCGDDVLFAKDNLSRHAQMHQKMPGHAVLGAVLWDPSIPLNDFMRFLAPAGPQFRFHTIRDVRQAGFHHFYTANISLDKKWFREARFDTRFRSAAFEDIDLGLVLEKKGLKVFYCAEARVYHAHYYRPWMFYRRMYRVGKNMTVFWDKHKTSMRDLMKIGFHYGPFMVCPYGLNLFHAVSTVAGKSRLVKHLSLRLHWNANISRFYSKGIIEAFKHQESENDPGPFASSPNSGRPSE